MIEAFVHWAVNCPSWQLVVAASVVSVVATLLLVSLLHRKKGYHIELGESHGRKETY